MRRNPDLSVYLVTDPALTRDLGLVETALAAVQGGVRVVQLRDPHAKGRALVEQARALVAALRPLGVPLIVNDRADVALAADADGLHVGQGDLSPADARALIGPNRLLGLSVTTEEQLAAVDPALVDHIGIGPLFTVDPRTKADASLPIGIAGFAALARRAPVPAVAIGGVKLEHAADVIHAGGAGVAVVSAICGQPDPEGAARSLVSRARSAGQPRRNVLDEGMVTGRPTLRPNRRTCSPGFRAGTCGGSRSVPTSTHRSVSWPRSWTSEPMTICRPSRRSSPRKS